MSLEKQEKALTDEYLAQLISMDQIGRNEDLLAFLLLLDEVKDGYSFFLDGKWGSGKTVFVKQSIITLKALCGTYKDELGSEVLESIGKFLNNLTEVRKSDINYLPIYYSAWENDVYTDPTVTILGTLIAESGFDFFGKKPSDASGKITALADTILKPFGLDVAGGLNEGFTAKNLLESMNNIQAVQENFKELVSVMLKERADKLVLFIDELDRCSPSFALQLIERIKFVLSMDNVIVVFSTDSTQLAHTIEGYYGRGFDGSRYLTRYYDLKLSLKSIRPSDYLGKKRDLNLSGFYDKIAQDIANIFDFSMRDCLRYMQDVDNTRSRAVGYSDPVAGLLAGGFTPVILALKIHDSSLYSKVLSGDAEKEFFEIASRSYSFERYLVNCFEIVNKRKSSGETVFETPESLFSAVYRETFQDRYSYQFNGERPKAFEWDAAREVVNSLFGLKGIIAT